VNDFALVVLYCSEEGRLALVISLLQEGEHFFGLLSTHAIRLINNFPDAHNTPVFDLRLDGEVVFIFNKTRVLLLAHFVKLPDLAFVVWLSSK
jgi:hypothetical protein